MKKRTKTLWFVRSFLNSPTDFQAVKQWAVRDCKLVDSIALAFDSRKLGLTNGKVESRRDDVTSWNEVGNLVCNRYAVYV